MFIIKQHLLLNKYNRTQESTDILNDSITKKADDIEAHTYSKYELRKEYNTFVLSLFIQIFIPIISVLSIALIITNNDAFDIVINTSTMLLLITAIAILIWASFRTIFKTVFFTLSIFLLLENLYFIFNVFICRYLVGFYNPMFSYENTVDPIMQVIKGNDKYRNYLFNQQFILALIHIIVSIFFILIAKRIFAISNKLKISKVLLYFVLYLNGFMIAYMLYSSGSRSQFFLNVTEVLILLFIFNFIIEMIFLYKSFRFKAFLKRFSPLFLIVTTVCATLSFDAIGFVDRVPKIDNIEQVTFAMHDFGFYDDDSDINKPQTFDIMKTYTFKSKEAIEAVIGLHRYFQSLGVALSNQKKLSGNELWISELKPKVVTDFNYKLKTYSNMKREYWTNFDSSKNLSIYAPLVKTKEYKTRFFKLLYYKDEAKLIFVHSIDKNDDATTYCITKEMKVMQSDLITTMRKDAEINSLLYLLKKDIVYKYSVQLFFNNTDEFKTDIFYIPPQYKNTIAYIESHLKEMKNSNDLIQTKNQ